MHHLRNLSLLLVSILSTQNITDYVLIIPFQDQDGRSHSSVQSQPGPEDFPAVFGSPSQEQRAVSKVSYRTSTLSIRSHTPSTVERARAQMPGARLSSRDGIQPADVADMNKGRQLRSSKK